MVRYGLLVASVGLLSVICQDAAAQRPAPSIIGPVVPKPAPTLRTVQDALATQFTSGAQTKLWNNANTSAKTDLLSKVNQLAGDIRGLPVGPVVPRPTTPPPPPPGQPKTDPNPTKQDWDATIQKLRDALAEKSKVNPDYQLPSKTADDVQRFIESLEKAKP